jgi:hypothetical protein
MATSKRRVMVPGGEKRALPYLTGKGCDACTRLGTPDTAKLITALSA